MVRRQTSLAVLLLALASCASQSAPVDMMEDEEDRTGAYVGGWDGAGTNGASVLLLRDGLIGTLSAATLIGDESEYHVTFDVDGTLAEDGEDLVLTLSCAEIQTRTLVATTPEDDNAVPPEWASMDCAGWELDLECGLAGECGVGDCNMVCDVVYFGDAYATAALSLALVEDEFDHWRRV